MTKKFLNESLKELKIEAQVEEILIDTEKKSKKYHFKGSPTIRINGKDIQNEVIKKRCLPCEDLTIKLKESSRFIKQECSCGCRVYHYQGKNYPYPPKTMIKAALKARNNTISTL